MADYKAEWAGGVGFGNCGFIFFLIFILIIFGVGFSGKTRVNRDYAG
ncbi:MAG: hypothetical protein ACYC38_00795 [Eubacteriales bacterium]